MKKKIAIWGTGNVCQEFNKSLVGGEIVAYIDSFQSGKEFDGRQVYTLDEFLKTDIEYDYIVVANVFTNDIYTKCLECNVDMRKVIFLRPLQNTRDVELLNRNLVYLQEIAPSYLEEALKESDRRMGIDTKGGVVLNCNPIYYYDYFRYRTFELIADQIRDLPGDVAEVGVYKGNFAKIINQKFPDSTFYLFDTFEGFAQEEAEKELALGNCNEEFIERFKETSVECVMSMLKFPEKCIIRKGFFPDTAQGIDTIFKFVSIDVDFEDSIFASIEYFYPRLVKNGFLFIHDYNEGQLKGVRNAVKRYEEKYGTVIKIPIADKCGTLIITK